MGMKIEVRGIRKREEGMMKSRGRKDAKWGGGRYKMKRNW